MRNKTGLLWLPNLNAWMSAILLFLLTGSLAFSIRTMWQFAFLISANSLRLSILVSGFVILLPILLIALVHHGLHVFLDRFFPDTRSPEMGRVSGAMPNIMSWWEGLYGWLVLVLSTLITMTILGVLLLSESYLIALFSALDSWDKTKYFLTLPTIVWIIVSAYLYHFESIVRRYLMTANQHS